MSYAIVNLFMSSRACYVVIISLLGIFFICTGAMAQDAAYGTIGVLLRPVNSLILGGTDITVTGRIVRNVYLGACFNGAAGETTNNYGNARAGTAHYTVSAGGFGAILKYRLTGNSKSAISATLQEKLDIMFLSANIIGEPILASNGYYALAPGLELFTSKLYFSLCYNFLTPGETHFGRIADFNGIAVSVDFTMKRKKGETTFYESTRRHHIYRGY